jgi:hypothetical protein
MVRLSRLPAGLLGALIRALTRSPRRRVALVAVPTLLVIALVAPRAAGRDDRPSRAGLAGGAPLATSTVTPTATIPSPTGLPGTTGPAPGPTVRPRPVPTLAKEPAAAARAYVLTANTHDARPGKDRGFNDSYARARPYVTAQLFALISAPSRRGDYLWAQWAAARATVAAEVLRVAVPDGAPAPTPTSAHVRVQFRQTITPHAAGGAVGPATLDEVSLVVTKASDGHWLVSQLLANT